MGVKPVEAVQPLGGKITAWQSRVVDGKDLKCNIYGSCIQTKDPIFVSVSDLQYSDGTAVAEGTTIKVRLDIKPGGSITEKDYNYTNGGTYEFSGITLDKTYRVEVIVNAAGDDQKRHKLETNFTNGAEANCDPNLCNENLETANPYKVCNQLDKTTEEYERCMDCFADKEGIWTAVGCIPQDPTSAVASIVQIGLGIAGGIVLIMILVGAFMFSTSQGDPNKTKEAKEIITSAIIGLIFVIFSVTMLQFIGVNILQIPGFGQ